MRAIIWVMIALGAAAPGLACAQSLDDTTIVYAVETGTFAIYLAGSGRIFETNFSGNNPTQGVQYALGQTRAQKVPLIDTTGGRLACDVRSRASINGRTVTLQAVYDCKFPDPSLNSRFTQQVVIHVDGGT